MGRVCIKFKDGTEKEFRHRPRAGGSWTLELRYEGGFAIVVDEWGRETAFPSTDISTIETTPDRY